MIRITDTIELDENEIQFKFIRSPGPGGQHVNKAATAVQLRFDVKHSPSLSEYVRARLLQLARNRINANGILIISANRFRSQDLNRRDALEKFADLILESTKKRKIRRRTKPTITSLKKRKEAKQRRAKLKANRQKVSWPGE
ncbi:MAG: alternative ribosome rescue aminoacyl-tRNA hydrolase ArfB [Desulfobulbales bacterium]